MGPDAAVADSSHSSWTDCHGAGVEVVVAESAGDLIFADDDNDSFCEGRQRKPIRMDMIAMWDGASNNQ